MSLLNKWYFWAKRSKLKYLSALIGQEAAVLSEPGDFPRTVHIFWDAGFENAPWIVKHCVKSWQEKNPNWNINLIDQEAANSIVARDTLPDGMVTSHYADLLRVRLLKDSGGVWVDATCFCMRPLDDWLWWIMSQTDFFVFQRPSYDAAISSWFIASYKSGQMISNWHAELQSYLKDRMRPPEAYFYCHFIFEVMLIKSRVLRKKWRCAPSLSAVPLHLLQRMLVSKETFTNRELSIISSTPLQKLTHKKGIEEKDLIAALVEVATYKSEELHHP